VAAGWSCGTEAAVEDKAAAAGLMRYRTAVAAGLEPGTRLAGLEEGTVAVGFAVAETRMAQRRKVVAVPGR